MGDGVGGGWEQAVSSLVKTKKILRLWLDSFIHPHILQHLVNQLANWRFENLMCGLYFADRETGTLESVSSQHLNSCWKPIAVIAMVMELNESQNLHR